MDKDLLVKKRLGKWSEVQEESYELIFSEAKERFEELHSDSESMTNKSIKMLSTIILVTGVTGGILRSNAPSCWVWIITVLYLGLIIYDFYLLLKLISPKQIIPKGAPPEKSIPDDLSNPDDQGYQIKLFYYHNILMLQRSIDKMEILNSGRSVLYEKALKAFFLILMISVVLTVFAL